MKKILLADDSITIQKVVELTFSEGDYQVVCVSNGAQALKKISETRPDIVLLDVIMPEKNGYEVCEQIKRDPATCAIPVLLLTGTFEPFDKKKAEAVGAQGHLTKPFESQALVGKVEEMLKAIPRVSSPVSGGMDIIAGGGMYHVDPDAPPQRGSQSPEPGNPAVFPSTGPVFGAATPGSDPAPGSPLSAAALPADRPETDWPHPATRTPDPAEGGSYVGFADLSSVASDEPEIVPDRFDRDQPPASATVRLDRDNLFRGDAIAPPPESPADVGDGAFALSDEPIEGITGGFDMPEPGGPEAKRAAEPRAGGDPVWTPPPEAPPAESWQDPGMADRPEAAHAIAPFSGLPPSSSGAPQNGAPTPHLTAEAIDLIAERVVERISERVVREVAWEVIPQMAEALVRRRIKELEEEQDR